MLKSHILCVLFTVCGLSFALATLSGEVAEILRRGGRFFPCMWQVQPGICNLVAEFNGKLNKIQVKTSIKSKNGCSIFDLTSSTAHRTNGGRRKYSNSEIDYFALYSLDRDKIYLMKAPDNPMTAITIRFEDTKSGKKIGVNYESDFLIENILNI